LTAPGLQLFPLRKTSEHPLLYAQAELHPPHPVLKARSSKLQWPSCCAVTQFTLLRSRKETKCSLVTDEGHLTPVNPPHGTEISFGLSLPISYSFLQSSSTDEICIWTDYLLLMGPSVPAVDFSPGALIIIGSQTEMSVMSLSGDWGFRWEVRCWSRWTLSEQRSWYFVNIYSIRIKGNTENKSKENDYIASYFIPF
jgi:hypothetical protein